MVTSADSPGTTRPLSGLGIVKLIFTGTRCTILMKLPVALSGGNKLNCAPVDGEVLLTVP